MIVTAEKIDQRLEAMFSEVLGEPNMFCADCLHCRVLKAVLKSGKARALAAAVYARYRLTGDPSLFAHAYAMGIADGIGLAETQALGGMAQ